MFATPAFAQTAGSAATASGPMTSLIQFAPLLLLGVLFYFMLIRPQQKRAREHAEKIKSVKRGDTVVLSNGVIGKIVRVEDSEVGLEIAQGVTVKVVKSYIGEVRAKGEPAPANDAKNEELQGRNDLTAMMALSRWKVIAVIAAVLFGIIFATPSLLSLSMCRTQAERDKCGPVLMLPGFMHRTLNLGLDLQGGSQLQMEVDVDDLEKARLTALEEDLRTRLTEDSVGFDQLVQINKGVEFHVLDPAQTTTIANGLRNKVGGALSTGQSNVVITPSGDRIRIAFVPAASGEAVRQAVTRSIEVIRRRIDRSGTKEPAITPRGENRIVIEAPGESDPEKLKALIGQTAKMTFQLVDEVAMQDNAAVAAAIQRGQLPPGDEMFYTSPNDQYYHGAPLLLKKKVIVYGDDLASAQQSFDSQTNAPVVSFRTSGKGARDMGAATAANIGKRFAVVLDSQIITAPTINGALSSGQITGNFTVESATELALLLSSGALPAKLDVIDQRTVGAELGADSIKAGMISLGIGAVAILVFIMLAYGLFGVFASIALLVNVLLIMAFMSVFQATLTFPGIAGIILTLAVAVDANVLIYERIRDESHAGRSLISALDHGFSRALVSILDANITSAISAVIMLWLGQGPVKGFAWTLLIGVITSVFTAVVITQVLIALWFRAKRPKLLPIA